MVGSPTAMSPRTIKAVLVPAWIEFAGAAQVAQVRRTVTKKGKTVRGRVPHYQRPRRRCRHSGGLGPRQLGDRKPASLVRDMTYQEDKWLARTGNVPRVMASLRSLAISLLRLDGHANIAAANRHRARDPHRTLKLLQTA